MRFSEKFNYSEVTINGVRGFYLLTDLMPIHILTTQKNEIFDNVPEHCKGEASNETKTVSKFCDEGVPGVDEVVSPYDGAQRPISENNAKRCLIT